MRTILSDTSTGKIIGAKEGTPEYEHEKAHIEYCNSEDGMLNNYIAQMCEYFCLVSLVVGHWINFFYYGAAVLIAVSLFLFMYEEIYCDRKSKRF